MKRLIIPSTFVPIALVMLLIEIGTTNSRQWLAHVLMTGHEVGRLQRWGGATINYNIYLPLVLKG